MVYINIKKVKEHYEIYCNNLFECSCDLNELDENVVEIKQKYQNMGLQTEINVI